MSLTDDLSERLDRAADAILSPLERAIPRSWLLERQPGHHLHHAVLPQEANDGIVTVNGVALPKTVIDQLRQLGISISWYSHAELEAAVAACSVDCQLIDDTDDNNFIGKLKYNKKEHSKPNQDEEDDDDDDPELDLYTRNMEHGQHGSGIFADPEMKHGSLFYDPKFRERIKMEREREREKKRREHYHPEHKESSAEEKKSVPSLLHQSTDHGYGV